MSTDLNADNDSRTYPQKERKPMTDTKNPVETMRDVMA